MDDTEFFFLLHVEENIRRHGGLEIGDTVSLSLVIKNTGKGWGRRNDKLWMRARFKTYGDGWQGAWTGFQGLWGSGKDSPGYFEGDLFDKEFHTTITGAGPDVKTKIEFHLDWQKVKFIFFIPKRTREVGIRKAGNDAITDTLGMPSLENYISDFYQSTSAYITYEGAMRLFNSAIEQYSYRDAYAFAAEFASIFPVFEELKDLPIKSNLKLNLPEDLIEMDGRTGIADVNLKLSLEGPSSDKQKNMMFKLIPYEGFSISDNIINAPLSSTLDFTLFREDPHLRVGVYLFGIEVYHGITSELIFNASIPFLLNGYSCVELVDQFSAEPIIPGDFFCVLDVNNLGTYAETINTTIDGIPNDFIYKDLHPDDFFDINKQFFELFPGDSYEGLLIKPPRHYTTKPGIYTYNFRARDHMFDSFDINCTSTFEVAEFYDMDFQLISTTPGNTIFDYQSAVYTFNLTNLGNVNQTFNISYDDTSFADEFYYSYDEYPLGDEESIPIELEPGESEFVDLVLIPTGWGEQSFNINATSFNNISTIPLNIEIIDDDINHPLLTDLKIIESPINITIEFNVLNEIDGDDRGLFCIELFIDNELIIYENPDPTEISFSLVINDTHGKWFIENGNHNIRIEITDADDDVPNDALKSSYTSSFETTLEDMHKYVLWKIENLKQKINESSDDYWRNPVSNLKNTMESKIDLSYTFLIFNEYDGAYSKFLHDIKPKLTGLKTDENEIEWGNGIFENPWINDESFQEELCLDCNEIMSYIKILASFV
ncbi:MAG: hypothetical protein GY870_10455 [archaeon]|nr:hypothetical protein [archaeon]